MSRSMKRFFFRFYLFILFLHMCIFPAWCFHQRTCMAQGLDNGVLNETWTHLCLQFEWCSVGYGFLWISIIHLRCIREVFSDALSSLPILGYFCIISASTVTPAWLWKSQAASVITTCYARASTKAKKK